MVRDGDLRPNRCRSLTREVARKHQSTVLPNEQVVCHAEDLEPFLVDSSGINRLVRGGLGAWAHKMGIKGVCADTFLHTLARRFPNHLNLLGIIERTSGVRWG